MYRNRRAIFLVTRDDSGSDQVFADLRPGGVAEWTLSPSRMKRVPFREGLKLMDLFPSPHTRLVSADTETGPQFHRINADPPAWIIA